ncbi:MAG: hypothetical protein DCF15_06030 [Phormidesmis priestleyi]|uniref:Uncharacterized protein n=1 Tax=Phormidesmis priestleyi TaxID=268141 RepID=A0A2W4XP88_9CYAN|nr:MAG: hypothetical protein DCF15_06030 [Phormidesmis priestleyi]
MVEVVQLGKLRRTKPSSSSAERIRKLLPTIEHYRSEGYGLTEIYSALVEEGLWPKTFNTFKCYYYSERRVRGDAAQKSICQQGEINGIKANADVPASGGKVEEEKKEKIQVPDVESLTGVSGSEKPSKKRRKIDFSVTLEEHQKLAASRFYK